MPCDSGIFVMYAEYEKVVAERNAALLDAERAREERNRVGVEIRREWMAKCEVLREVARKQYYELEGVVVDTERGHGFDEVCLNTIKRVQGELAAMSKEQS
jgi:hypothetical protein